MGTYTPNLSLYKPAYHEAGATWWSLINANFDILDSYSAEHNILSAIHSDTVVGSLVAGDILYVNVDAKLTRLPKSTNGYVMTMVAGYPGWAASTIWTDRTTYIDPNNATGELQIGDSGQLVEPVALIKKSIATTVAIGAPTGVTGDFIPTGNVGGHVGLFGTIVRTADSSGFNLTPYFFAYKDKVMQNGQNPCFVTWMNIAGGSGGAGATAFAGWDLLIGHTSGTYRLIGREINVVEARADQLFHYRETTSNNWSAGLIVVPETTFEGKTGYNCTWGLFIAKSSLGASAWNCGIRVNPDALVHGLYYTNIFTAGALPIGIALQLERAQAIRWCHGSGPTTGFFHDYYYPLITADNTGQFYVMVTASYWWRFGNTGALQKSTDGGATWSTYTNP